MYTAIIFDHCKYTCFNRSYSNDRNVTINDLAVDMVINLVRPIFFNSVVVVAVVVV